MSFLWLWSAARRIVKQLISAWRAEVVVILLCQIVAAGCDVRPFSDLAGNDTSNNSETGGDETGGNELLEINADRTIIDATVGTPEMVELSVVNPDSDRMYTWTNTTPTSGTASITRDTEDTSMATLTFTPNNATTSDSLEVTVTDDGSPALSGTKTISITVTE